MKEVIVINLRRIGHLESCKVVRDTKNDNYWNLEFKALDSQGGEISKLEDKNGKIKTFNTKESAQRYGQKLGFDKIIVNM